jgi:hypothetical protein
LKDKLIIYIVDKMPMVLGGFITSHHSFIIMGGPSFNLGSKLFCTTNDNEMMKKWADFVQIKFHFEWKYWMKLHSTWIELNLNRFNWIPILKFDSNSIKLNSRSPIKKNDMQINAKVIENLFIISIIHNYGVEKKLLR